MKILVTGAAGFLGSILVPLLIEKGYKVKALDNFYFGIDSLRDVEDDSNLEVIKVDTRKLNPAILSDVSVVVDLAAIGQPDPQGLIDIALYYDINCLAPVRVATLSKLKGVKRYIFASTCSVYGVQKNVVNEESKLNPLDRYAKTKSIVEENVLKLTDNKFSVTVLRFATLYGYSPKMRFDLLLNGMVLSAFQTNKIMILGDGQQKRPIVHVKDVADAILKVVNAEEEKVKGEIYNVGSNAQNFSVYEVAELTRKIFKNCKFEFYGDPDKRSYVVNFDKISDILKFRPKYTPEDGVREIQEALESGKLRPQDNHWVIRWWAKLCKEGKVW
ncbi:MAG: NAD-dependent epimerase/dehydratase family protein [Candidatus Omnitrophica bacterium]|nr:NAD-dependent epimerase/dehydratase family protein [Candidatus Omnitrophota bacterium]